MLAAIVNIVRRAYGVLDRFFFHLGFEGQGIRQYFSWFVIIAVVATLLPLPSTVTNGILVAWMVFGCLAILIWPGPDLQQSRLMGIGGLMLLACIVPTQTWLADMDATEPGYLDGQPIYRIVAFFALYGIGMIGFAVLFAAMVNGFALGLEKQREEATRRGPETRRQQFGRITLDWLSIPLVAIVAGLLALRYPDHAPAIMGIAIFVIVVGLAMIPTLVKSIRRSRSQETNG